MFTSVLALAAIAGSVVAQRPANTTICDYYSNALFNKTDGATQLALLTAIVNRAVIGNTTANGSAVNVPGILSPNATINGTSVNLAKYFTGAIASTNVNDTATAVNWLDGGGAAPLANGTSSNNTASNQDHLLTHLYSYFGTALGCSSIGNDSFPAYAGEASMYTVHKYMVLDEKEVAYFIQQVGLSALSFGAAMDDVTAVGSLLSTVFNVKCAAAATVIPAQGPQLQSICLADSCPQAANASCSSYASNVPEPMSASSTAISPTASVSGSNPASASSSGAAIANVVDTGMVGKVVAAVFALFAIGL